MPRTGCTSSTGVPLYMKWEYPLCLRKKRGPYRSPSMIWTSRPRMVVQSQLCVQKRLHRSLAFISRCTWLKNLRQCYRWEDYATPLVVLFRGRQEEPPDFPKNRRLLGCGIENLVPMVAVIQQGHELFKEIFSATTSCEHEKEMEETMLDLLKPCTEGSEVDVQSWLERWKNKAANRGTSP